MAICKRVYYSGRVQGVGFRYTAQSLAQGFAVAGYVRNLSSGDVELIVEGESAMVEAFLAAVGRHMGHYIEETRAEDLQPSGLQGFRIRH
jgi:acylphosphatase